VAKKKEEEASFELSYESDGIMGKNQNHTSKQKGKKKEKDELFSNINQYSE
jgi:hypothetical protein